MSQAGFLFFNVLLPIFLQIGAGYALQKRFRLDTPTLSKLQFYILVPALTFTSLYHAQLDAGLLLGILACNLVLFVLLLALAAFLVRVGRVSVARRRAFYNAVCLYNSGNYCIPLIQLLYATPLAYSVQIIIMLLQSCLTNTFGVFNAAAGTRRLSAVLRSIVLMPMMLAMLAAVAMRLLEWPLWSPLKIGLQVLGQGMVPLALVTLGAQLANTRIRWRALEVYLAVFLRLMLAPLLAFAVVQYWDLQGEIAQVIVICAAAPSAVNTVLLAIEFGGDPEFASQSVLISTLLSALTVPWVIGASLRWL